MSQLGFLVQDKITGFKGTLIGVVDDITGCRQYLVQPAVKENGDFVENRWIDEDRLTVLGDRQLKLAVDRTGGDVPAPRK